MKDYIYWQTEERKTLKKIKEKEDDIVNLKQNLEKLIKENKDTMQSNDELNKLIQSHKNTIDDLKKDIDNEKDKYQKTIDALTQEKNKIIKEEQFNHSSIKYQQKIR